MLAVRNLERQQEESHQIEQESGDMADPVPQAGELLRPRDSLVVAPLRDEGRNDQNRAERVRDDREEDVDPKRFSSPRNDSPKSFARSS